MDETGQASRPDTAGAARGGDGPGEPQTLPNGWPAPAGSTSDDSLAAIVSAWREPVAGATGARAGVNGHDPAARGRAEVRATPYADLLAPMSPAVPASPPPAPPASDPGPAKPVSGAEPPYRRPPAEGRAWGADLPPGYRPPSQPTSSPPVPAPALSQLPPPTSAPTPLPPASPLLPERYRSEQFQAGRGQATTPGPNGGAEPSRAHRAEDEPVADERTSFDSTALDEAALDRSGLDSPRYRHNGFADRRFDSSDLSPFGPAAHIPQQGYTPPVDDDLTPLFDQQPPPSEPDLDWNVPPYAEPSPALTAPTPPSGNRPVLPRRVPAEPDVPDVPARQPEPVAAEGAPAAAPDLARIAARLRHDEDDEIPGDGRPDGFDIPAVLEAVRGVPGVREARLRTNPDGVHTLRLELADDADPGCVSRAVARLLNERMGLAAEPSPAVPSAPLSRPVSASRPAAAPGSRSAAAPPPYSALPTFGREARRRRPVSGIRRSAGDPGRPSLASVVPPLTHPSSAPPSPRPSESDRSATPTSAPPRSIRPVAPPASTPPVADSPSTDHWSGSWVGGTRPGPTAPDYPSAPRSPGADGQPPATGSMAASRVMIDQVEVVVHGIEAVVEVRLSADGQPALGVASGPSQDGYVLRLAASAAAAAIDELLVDPHTGAHGRCYIEHATLVPLGGCDVALVVLLLTCDGWVEQLTGSAVVGGDPRQAIVRATLAAVNRRLEALLP